MKRKLLLFPCLLLCFISGCKRVAPAPSANYMVLDEVNYISEFPHSHKIGNGIPVTTDAIGAQTFAIYDTLLFIQTSDPANFWSVYSLPDERLLGKFFPKGNGPNEFLWAPALNHTEFYKENGRIFARIFDYMKDRIVMTDITGMIENSRAEFSVIVDKLDRNAINAILLNGNDVFCRKLSNNGTQLPRYISKGGKDVTPDNLDKLNLSEVKPGEDHNILAADLKYNREKNLILETPTMLNHINLYSPDGSTGKTICVGKRIDDISHIQDTEPAYRMYTYDGAKIFDDFFAALYCNEDVLSYETERKTLPTIQFFDWEGNPVFELKLDRFCTSFAIDTVNGYLYTFNAPTEETYKYDIKNIPGSPV